MRGHAVNLGWISMCSGICLLTRMQMQLSAAHDAYTVCSSVLIDCRTYQIRIDVFDDGIWYVSLKRLCIRFRFDKPLYALYLLQRVRSDLAGKSPTRTYRRNAVANKRYCIHQVLATLRGRHTVLTWLALLAPPSDGDIFKHKLHIKRCHLFGQKYLLRLK